MKFKREDRIRHKADGRLGTINSFWCWGAWVVLWDDGTQSVVDETHMEKADAS